MLSYYDFFSVFVFLIASTSIYESFVNLQFSHARLAVSFLVPPRLGICMSFFVSSNPQAISMAISIAVKSLNTMHHDSMSVNFVRFLHTFPFPHNAT